MYAESVVKFFLHLMKCDEILLTGRGKQLLDNMVEVDRCILVDYIVAFNLGAQEVHSLCITVVTSVFCLTLPPSFVHTGGY
jgi:hypothetical protein